MKKVRKTLNVDEVAQLLGIGRTLAYQAVRRGEIPSGANTGIWVIRVITGREGFGVAKTFLITSIGGLAGWLLPKRSFLYQSIIVANSYRFGNRNRASA